MSTYIHTYLYTFICSNKHMQHKVAMQLSRTERHSALTSVDVDEDMSAGA